MTPQQGLRGGSSSNDYPTASTTTATNAGRERAVRLHALSIREASSRYLIDQHQHHPTPTQHTLSTVALCICVLTHSYLLISAFPYAGFMAMDLIDGVDEENAGLYAGFLAASFMVGRATTSYSWGKWADVYGRVTIIYISLACSCLFTFLFGISPTYGWALTFRFLLGLGNGILGSVKTSVSELANGNDKLETRGMGLVMGMWGWGFLFSPALSGALAEPIKQYPDNVFLQQHFGETLSTYPFLLPNLMGVFFCVVAMASLYFFVYETLPEDQRRSPRHIPSDIMYWWQDLAFDTIQRLKETVMRRQSEQIPLASSTPSQSYTSDMERSFSEQGAEEGSQYSEATTTTSVIDGDMLVVSMTPSESCSFLATAADRVDPSVCSANHTASEYAEPHYQQEMTIGSLWANPRIRSHLMVYWMSSFTSVSVDEAFPLFCMSKTAGLGLSEKSIGNILSLSGLIFAICQYFVFSTIVNRCGIYKSIRVVTLIQIPVLFAFPISLLLNRDNMNPGDLTWRVHIFLGAVMAVYRVLGNVFYSSLSMAINRSVPAHQRGTVNGMSVLVGSIAKACGPAFAGILVAVSLSMSPHVGAVVVFATLGTFGSVVAYSANRVLKEEDDVPASPKSVY